MWRFILLLLLATACDTPAEGEGEGEGEGAGEGEGEGEGEEVVEATPGVFCPTEARVGFVRVLDSFGSIRLDGRMDSRVPLGPPLLDEPPCAHYSPTDCGGCPNGQECHYDGTCGEANAPRDDVVVTVNDVIAEVDEFTGRIEAELDGADVYDMRVRIRGVAIVSFSSSMPPGFADFMTAQDQGDLTGSGPVTMTWASVNDGSAMHLFLKPNHHAPIGFSECIVEDAAETVTASSEMVEPLRLVTGFEGGTATRQFVGSAQLDIGCVELAVGTTTLIIPE